MDKNREFLGYRRQNGRVGIRNHVVILPVDDISNACCEAVANHIKGTMALPHAYGRLQFGEDLQLFFRTMIGTGSNPNVAAVVVIGIEPEWTNQIVNGIAETGKPVTGFSIERFGDIETIAKASRKAYEYVQWASELQRVECAIDSLYVSTKCGESDTTSGLASNPTVGNVFDRLNDMGATLSFGEISTSTISGNGSIGLSDVSRQNNLALGPSNSIVQAKGRNTLPSVTLGGASTIQVTMGISSKKSSSQTLISSSHIYEGNLFVFACLSDKKPPGARR